MKSRRKFLSAGAAMVTAFPFITSKTIGKDRDQAIAARRFDPGKKIIRDAIKLSQKGKSKNIPPVLRDEILENPDAVFLIKTGVVSKKDVKGRFPAEKDQMWEAGYYVAQRMFRKGTKTGGSTFIKPNFVGRFGEDLRRLNSGISTHPWFVGGFSKYLKEIGNSNIVVGTGNAQSHENYVASGIAEMMHENKLIFFMGHYDSWDDYRKSEIAWVDNPDGVVMQKIPFFKLVQDTDTTFINMAKDRIHQLGFTTLTIKNLQGIMPKGYRHLCQSWKDLSIPKKLQPNKLVFNPDYQKVVEELYKKHARMGFKYWDDGGFVKDYYAAGGWDAYKRGEFEPDNKVFWGEQWGQRMMDVATKIKSYVNLVEGIVGIDGAGTLHLNNFITVSQSMVSCDSVAAWLMGQEPRELPFLRIASERGMGNNNIEQIPIYELTDREVKEVKDYRTLNRARMGVRVYGLKENPLRFF